MTLARRPKASGSATSGSRSIIFPRTATSRPADAARDVPCREEIATLDLLAGGRVDIGLGRGYQHYEFQRLGLELESARARWEESVDIILKALEGEPFSYSGKLFTIPETTIFPRPLQQPHPPIWVTAQSPESVEATVRRGFNLLTGGFGVPIERMAEFRKQFDRLVDGGQAATRARGGRASARST